MRPTTAGNNKKSKNIIYATADTRLTTNYQQSIGSHAQTNSASQLQIRNNSAAGSN